MFGRTEEEEKSTAPFVILKMGKQTDPPKHLKTCMHVACVYVSHALCCVAGTRAQPQQTSPPQTVVSPLILGNESADFLTV